MNMRGNPRASPRAEGMEGGGPGGGTGRALAVGPEDTHSSHLLPTSHSRADSIVRGLGMET